MMSRRMVCWVVAAVVSSMGATYRTPNFVVQAPTPQIAQQVGEYAEKWRKEKALEWLGKEMPTWGQPCPLRVTITPGGAGGATTFAFDRGAILSQEMNVQGSLERILNSVLPHEVTHTVFAYHFRQPLPRWADEGGCVLSEDDLERRRHDELVRQSLAGGRAFRLRVLFDMKQYPTSGQDIMTLYAQGYSLSRFLVETTDRRRFLDFVGEGMRSGWDNAVRIHLGMNRVEDLEAAWLDWMRGTFQPDSKLLTKNTRSGGPTQEPSPPLSAPVGRGTTSSPLSPGGTGAGSEAVAALDIPPSSAAVVRGASPEETRPRLNPQDGWSPLAGVPPLPQRPAQRPPVARLLAPEMEPWEPPARQAVTHPPR
ncbi:MAG: hypothetical protein NZM31_10965 [Gemmatales bacterium]|nr:hypothetical protein [Gemmatales bacterium]MDW8387516.1 hypothetical protein [Gemmatales bacterium]